MPTVTFVDPLGRATTIDAAPGASLMAAAVRHGVPGIVGECGGNASCATCHVYLDPGGFRRVGPPNDLEDDLLDLGVADRRPASRLACQITLTDELDGLLVHTPESQG